MRKRVLTPIATLVLVTGSMLVGAPSASAHLIVCQAEIEQPTKIVPLGPTVAGGWEVHCDDKMDIIDDTVYLQEYFPGKGWVTMKKKWFLHSFDANFIDEISYGNCSSPWVQASWRTKMTWTAYHETWHDYVDYSPTVTLKC